VVVAEALKRFQPESYDPDSIREHVSQWDRFHFRDRVCAVVQQASWAVPGPTRFDDEETLNQGLAMGTGATS
jgi:hypothetical protein